MVRREHIPGLFKEERQSVRQKIRFHESFAWAEKTQIWYCDLLKVNDMENKKERA